MPDSVVSYSSLHAVTHASIPTDEESFKIDKTEKILDGFHNYDSTTHLVSAASDNFFIIQTGSAFAKFSVVDLTQVFYAMSSVTFNVAMQAEGNFDGFTFAKI